MSEAQERTIAPRQVSAAEDQANATSDTHEPSQGDADTSKRAWFSFRRPTLSPGHTHRGFGQSEKSDIPEPQSTPVLVFGEVSAPHPSNCKHQGPGEPGQAQTDDEDTEEEEPEEIFSPKTVGREDVDEPSRSDHESSTNSTQQESDSVGLLGYITPSDGYAPAATLALPAPAILVSPPPETAGSLGTRAILGTAGKAKMVSFWGADTSKSPAPVPGGDLDTLPQQVPTAQALTDILPADGLSKAGLPTTDLPSVAAVPLPLEIPAVPALPSVVENGADKPHAKKRVRRKLKQKAQPQVAKARKLILKKKILSKLLGKELAAILEPHLNAATSGAGMTADSGPRAPAPVPL